MTTEKLSVEVIECVQLVGCEPTVPADPLYRVEVAGRCFDFDIENTANLMVTAINDHVRGLHDDLVKALKGLLEIDEARIATGAFEPNAEGQRRIDAARAALAKAGTP